MEQYNEGKEHKACYGKYMDKDGNICEEGASGLLHKESDTTII